MVSSCILALCITLNYCKNANALFYYCKAKAAFQDNMTCSIKKDKVVLLCSPYCTAQLNWRANDEAWGRQTPTAICVPFIKTEGVDKCGWERN